MTLSTRSGLTLIEVIIAILVLAVGALGLAATSAAVARQLTSSQLRTRAAQVAQTRQEKTNASTCSTSASSDAVPGVVDDWTTVATAGTRVLIEQSVKRRDSKGLHTDRFLSAAPCD